MYNRILNRPMFKRGGDVIDSQGTGITSGLDTPRNNYAGGGTIGGGNIHGNPIGNRTGFEQPTFEEQVSEIDVSVPESTRKRAFWSGIGEGFSNARTLGEALRGGVKGQSAILDPAEAAAGERRFELDKMPLELEMGKEIAKAGIAETAAQTDERTLARAMKMKKEWEDANPGEDFIGSENYTDWEHLIIQATDGKITTLSEARQTALNILIADGDTSFAKQWKMFEYLTKEEKATLLSQIKRLQDLFMGKNFEERASGGRIGYNTGVGPNVMDKNIQMSEQINTPQGDVSMTEDVNVMNADPMAAGAGSAGGEDPYLLLRARLPQEITDDVVRLIAYNPDAFKDFASIESQEDVMSFNQKYGVELVLPTEQA
tara:strand:- start:5568 stop:6686 length:1119 start_codon:yes stop_codon:yes gene_type:complete